MSDFSYNINKQNKILDCLKELEIYKKIHEITLQELKKAYHIQILLHHPDKNFNDQINSNEKFRNIKESYNYLYSIINNNSFKYKEDENNNEYNDKDKDEQDKDEEENSENNYKFTELLLNFINFLISNKDSNITNNIDNNVKKFKNECCEYRNKILKIFLDKLNIDELEKIYKVISEYSCENNADIILYVKNYLLDKLESYNIYILNANISNLLNSDIYKLTIDNNTIYIPLWHNELDFNNNIIKIQNKSEDNLIIDNNNNINYYYYNNFANLIELLKTSDEPYITINLANGALELKIDLDKICFKKYQKHIFKNIGIPKINNFNIFDNSIKGNIIIHINLS
tara:strand:- start:1806 stop:2834 length:1029 start_codon:yes stop_codon:yes gene_type:complete